MHQTTERPNHPATHNRTHRTRHRPHRLLTATALAALITSAALTAPATAAPATGTTALADRPAGSIRPEKWISSAAPNTTSRLSGPATETATAAVQLALPAPTGRYRVGRDTLDLLDPHRADPWVPTQRRELMVSLWYPTARPGGVPAPYMTAAESRLFLHGVSGVPEDALTTVQTHASLSARVLPGTHRRPLVVLSPGWGNPRSTLTGLAEDLASHGYVVAAIDHTYEATGVSFPDGRVAECVPCARDLDPDKDGPVITGGRAKDVSFVLDRLLARTPAWPGARSIDSRRIAMAGHSIGGASALTAMLTDRRIDAGVNLDGTFFPALDRPFRRPFLMISNPDHGPGTDRSWTQTWQHLTGWKRWLSVTGTTHSSFTDLAPLADQVGQPIQPMPGERASEITRRYVSAFLDLQLRGHREPLLNRPSSRYPEVQFQTP
jgi:predicted dienelactone hydrolase